MRAIALDETLPEAHASLGMLHMASGNLAAAEARMKRAAALDPGHSRIREWLSFVYQMQDRQVEALAESRRAVENDPLSPSAQAELARALCLNGRVAEGLDRLATLESLEPPLARVGVYRMLCLGKAGDWNSAAKAVSRGHVFGVALLGHAYGRIGQKDSAQAMLAELAAHWQRTEEGAFLVAMVYAGLGDHDRAFEWLNRSIDEASLIAQMMSPIFDDLKPDPRYRRFRARLDAGANKQ